MTSTILTLAVCTAVAIFVPLYRKRHLCNHSILDRILPDRFRDLHAYIQGEELSPCEEFWQLSRGLSGVASRLRDMFLIVRLLQHQRRAGIITASDARHVWEKARLQVFLSLLAVPEAALCLVWKRYPHCCGLFALRSHYEVAVWAYTVCSDEDADLQLSRLL